MEDIIKKVPKKYREDVQRGIDILKEAGCKEVYLFGSLINGNEREGSDIDIAVRGCPTGMYFHILGKLMYELNHPVDLINLDEKDDFVNNLERKGRLTHV